MSTTVETKNGAGVGSPLKRTAEEAGVSISPADDAATSSSSADTTTTGTNASTTKIDPITALQDDIDGLSLAMFEALRGLRDAVAPESGNLAGENNPDAAAAANNNNGNNGNAANESNTAPDMDEMWQAYLSGDLAMVQLMQTIVASTSTATAKATLPKRRDDFIRLYTQMEMDKDTELVMKLAGTIQEKSYQIDKRCQDYLTVERCRTREQQMARIQELLILNQGVVAELEGAYLSAKERRDVCRSFIRDNTCAALGIEQVND
jgi:hypothetical protein